MKLFRLISLIEGCSLLILLLIAMPLKYKLGVSDAVFYAGISHGMLFLLYLVMSLITSHQQKWPVMKWLLVFLAGTLPFGFLIVDRSLKNTLTAKTIGATA